jgi:hypothetical protein
MKIAVLTSGFLLFSMTALASSGAQQVELGSDKTYTIDGMKERCRQFQSSSQLNPFSIRIECAKTENRWEAVPQQRPLPMWVEYNAAGMGKGQIEAEKVKENLAPQQYECTNYQEKTILYKGYVELSCDDFIENVSSLKTLCAEGFVGKQGAESKVDWTQVGEAETGSQFTSGCNSQITGQQETGQEKPGQEKPGQQQESGQQQPGQQQEVGQQQSY